MSKKHTHKYHKVLVSGVKLFACGFPDCTHHMPKHYESLLIGKASYCWKCGDRMLLDKDNMRYDFPWCLSCKFGEVQGSNTIEEIITDITVNPIEEVIMTDTESKTSVKVITQQDLNDLFK